MSRTLKFRVWHEMCHNFGYFKLEDGSHLHIHGEPEQFTGLKDKNGKEIYEGDILETTCCGKAEVYFDDELLMHKIRVRHGGTMPLVGKKSIRHFDYEVIGNIHENPELLENHINEN